MSLLIKGLRKLSILKSMVTSSYESKNRYYFRSRIVEAKFRQIIYFFGMDFTASDTAKLTNISLRSINTIYIKLFKKIAIQCEEISPFPASLSWMNLTLALVVF